MFRRRPLSRYIRKIFCENEPPRPVKAAEIPSGNVLEVPPASGASGDATFAWCGSNHGDLPASRMTRTFFLSFFCLFVLFVCFSTFMYITFPELFYADLFTALLYKRISDIVQ